jgi:hypothetical protein
MNDNEYRPMSTDAMFARILERLDELKADRTTDREQLDAQGSRITDLERDKWFQRGIAATVALMVGAAWQWITRK